MNMWRLGLDIGSNSIGWTVLELEEGNSGRGPAPRELIEMGVRVFPDGREPSKTDQRTGMPKIGESLAVERRNARGMRRNRDRRLDRIRLFADRMVEFGLLPVKNPVNNAGYKVGILNERISPLAARARAAQQPVTKEELARALFHLCKRRGFLSNRNTDAKDKEETERKTAMEGLAGILAKRDLTLGQYLFERIKNGKHVRFRGDEFDAEEGVSIYPTRAMYVDEFHAIRSAQGNVNLSDEQWDALFDVFSFQRPLLPTEPGTCSFEHGRDGREKHLRASRHLPVAHTFRILQEVNNLRYLSNTGEERLTSEQRQVLCAALERQKKMAFSMIRSMLNIDKSAPFNLESIRRKELAGNGTACDMDALFSAHGLDWRGLGESQQNDVVQMILDAKNLEEFLIHNREKGWNFPAELIRDLSAKHYSSSHGHISRRCMEKLIPLMREGLQYWEAARAAYGDHTDYCQFATGEVVEQLPYYGQVLRGATSPVRNTPSVPEEEKTYGKIPNPTVHVALNQLRKLVNALVARYGAPWDIHLELAREVKNAGKRYQELLKGLAENTTKNQKRTKMFHECFPGRTPSGLDLLKIRLWEELAADDSSEGDYGMARKDVYTGKNISFSQLFSDAIEVEHILPFGRTFDNSTANKTVTFRDVNRRKGGDRLPYDFAQADSHIDAEALLERAKRLPRGKRWRFQPDATEIYERIVTRRMTAEERRRYDADKSGAFIDRQLVDTQYTSRIAARYLTPLVGEPSRVVPVNGHVTNLIRAKWDINVYKAKGEDLERQDIRHHAEDALIVALADRGLIKLIADNTRSEQEERGEYRAKLQFPERPAWLTTTRIREVAERIIISYRPDHSREKKLHQETAYGFLSPDDPWTKEGYNAVTRRPIIALKENEIDQIRDDAVRLAIQEFLVRPDIAALTKWEDRRAKLAQARLRIGSAKEKTRMRRVRIVVKNQSITPVPSARYKGYATDSIAFCDIWHAPKYTSKGKPTGKWGYVGAYVSYADALRFDGDEEGLHERCKPHPAAKKIMRLFKNDMVMLTDEQGNEQVTRIAGFSATDNRLDVRPHTESAGKQNYKAIPVLMERFAMRKVRVSVAGRLLL